LVEAIVKLTKEFNPGEIVYNLSVNSEGTTVTKIAEIVVEELGLKNVHFALYRRRSWLERRCSEIQI
jgi:UDP-glucose 4-epimerase